MRRRKDVPPLPAFNGEVGTEFACLSSKGTRLRFNVRNPYSWILTGGGTFPQPFPSIISFIPEAV
ncbi:hypothetical protein J6590_060445 [Homalodisca vitripennis]|nr:hypothetical protein J6590_060445 [Homalodisca vitripennis]